MIREELNKIRLKYKYRNLILRGRIKIPPSGAKKLIGPDCAYHLYRNMGPKEGMD